MSLYGSPNPAPLFDPVIDLMWPFAPLTNRICRSELLIDLVIASEDVWEKLAVDERLVLCKSSEAVVEVMMSTEGSGEAMKSGGDHKCEVDVHRCILLE